MASWDSLVILSSSSGHPLVILGPWAIIWSFYGLSMVILLAFFGQPLVILWLLFGHSFVIFQVKQMSKNWKESKSPKSKRKPVATPRTEIAETIQELDQNEESALVSKKDRNYRRERTYCRIPL